MATDSAVFPICLTTPFLAGLAAGLLGLGPGGAARAQCHAHAGYVSHGGAHHYGRSPADTVKTTERNNRWGFGAAPALVRDGLGSFYGGLDLELGYFVAPRLQVGGHFLFTGRTAAPSNFGYDATAPALHLLSGGASLRYQLVNTRRWRLDALGGAGVGGFWLADRDKQVAVGCGCHGTQPALVAKSLGPQLESGLGLTYKLKRDFWLTSNLRYNYTLGAAPFGEPALQAQWQWMLGVAVPAGFVARASHRVPASQ